MTPPTLDYRAPTGEKREGTGRTGAHAFLVLLVVLYAVFTFVAVDSVDRIFARAGLQIAVAIGLAFIVVLIEVEVRPCPFHPLAVVLFVVMMIALAGANLYLIAKLDSLS